MAVSRLPAIQSGRFDHESIERGETQVLSMVSVGSPNHDPYSPNLRKQQNHCKTGFFFRENIAGGAELDFLNFTWPVIQAFKNDFSETIINYGSYGEGTLPLFHILNAYVNPFSFNEIYFQASIAVISLLNTIFFSKIIEKNMN